MIVVKQILERKEVLPFKKRQPKKDSIWYFRINKQYRAIGYIDDDRNLIIVEIDNHQ